MARSSYRERRKDRARDAAPLLNMARITITGASDDLIEIGGDIQEEFSFYGGDSRLIAVSDGTLLRACYDKDGIWRFTPLIYGSAHYSKVDGSVERDTFDVVSLEGEIKWVALATQWARA